MRAGVTVAFTSSVAASVYERRPTAATELRKASRWDRDYDGSQCHNSNAALAERLLSYAIMVHRIVAYL